MKSVRNLIKKGAYYARCESLGRLYQICETQKNIKTHLLINYIDKVADVFRDISCDYRDFAELQVKYDRIKGLENLILQHNKDIEACCNPSKCGKLAESLSRCSECPLIYKIEIGDNITPCSTVANKRSVEQSDWSKLL